MPVGHLVGPHWPVVAVDAVDAVDAAVAVVGPHWFNQFGCRGCMDALVFGPHWSWPHWPQIGNCLLAGSPGLRCIFGKVLMMITMMITAVIVLRLIIIIIAKIVVARKDLKMVGW